MAETVPEIHRRLARIGLRVGGRYGFALAGGHAVAAHGILVRPSEDVDLFADWQRRADFPTAVDEVIAAYQHEGFRVEVDLRLDTFARLFVTDPGSLRSGIAAGHVRDEVVWAVAGASGGAGDVGLAVDVVETDRGVTERGEDCWSVVGSGLVEVFTECHVPGLLWGSHRVRSDLIAVFAQLGGC